MLQWQTDKEKKIVQATSNVIIAIKNVMALSSEEILSELESKNLIELNKNDGKKTVALTMIFFFLCTIHHSGYSTLRSNVLVIYCLSTEHLNRTR